ncbi:hypothetical protein PT974_02733 [Cladobotryum mycophilum]|uniref:Uncharacterized protein n=1 Tax=Cladobotryum mycophilum TaxID=491253 RepID=A0ABR0SYX7_9HYPO
MSAFPRQFSTASPVLAIPPQPSHQNHLGMATFAHQHQHKPMSGHPSSSTLHRPVFTGRKRSRDEAAINLEPDTPSVSSQESQKDWVYGEGMVLIKPDVGYVAEASSQSGTWVEERNAEQETRTSASADIVAPRCHKSQRINVTTRDEASASATSILAPGIVGTSTNSAGEPVIDDFTLHLGIGWRRISNGEHIQAAARGWARFIENHYPLSNVNIRLESKGLQSYLVETSQGFYLFSEDLRQARLVSRDVNGALQNLQRTPPSFEGDETLLRAESPQPSENHVNFQPTDTAMTLD